MQIHLVDSDHFFQELPRDGVRDNRSHQNQLFPVDLVCLKYHQPMQGANHMGHGLDAPIEQFQVGGGPLTSGAQPRRSVHLKPPDIYRLGISLVHQLLSRHERQDLHILEGLVQDPNFG